MCDTARRTGVIYTVVLLCATSIYVQLGEVCLEVSPGGRQIIFKQMPKGWVGRRWMLPAVSSLSLASGVLREEACVHFVG